MKPIRSAIPFLPLLGLLFCAGAPWPQGIQRRGPVLVQIHGQVCYRSGAAAREDVMITIESAAGGSAIAQLQTDTRGAFKISSIPQAVYTVKAHQPGYRDHPRGVAISAVRSAYATLTLTSQAGNTAASKGTAPCFRP